MELRPLAVEDLILCEPFGKAFMAEGHVEGDFSLATFCEHWGAFLRADIGTIIGLWDGIELKGGIGGLITPDVNSGKPVASELFWYIAPDARGSGLAIRLLKEFQQWARSRGATRLRLVHLLQPDEQPDGLGVKLAALYHRMGLKAIEVAYDGPIGV